MLLVCIDMRRFKQAVYRDYHQVIGQADDEDPPKGQCLPYCCGTCTVDQRAVDWSLSGVETCC